MRRNPLNWRQQVYNEADFYKLSPLVRKPVAPGDTISTMVVDARFVDVRGGSEWWYCDDRAG